MQGPHELQVAGTDSSGQARARPMKDAHRMFPHTCSSLVHPCKLMDQFLMDRSACWRARAEPPRRNAVAPNVNTAVMRGLLLQAIVHDSVDVPAEDLEQS